MDPVVVKHFVRMRKGDSIGTPSWLLRRVESPSGPVDELLGRDAVWRPSEMLARAERGELLGGLRPLGPGMAAALVTTIRQKYEGVCRALARQRVGEFVLRMPASGHGVGLLDAEARGELAAFLTGAPLVEAGPEGTFRTDGMWVWPEAIAEQVLVTGLPPEGEFFVHIMERAYFYPADLEPAVLDRARLLLQSGSVPDGEERVQETHVPGQPPPPTPAEQRQALAAWHSEWERKHAASTPYHPERYADDSDYHQHYVDVEASPEAEQEYQARAREIMGLDPETGRRVDL